MSDLPKKVSFGFTKLKPVHQKKATVRNDIQFIDCLESKAIKIKGEEPQEEVKELVIPVHSNRIDSGSKLRREVANEPSSSDQPTQGEPNTSESLEAIAVKEILLESQKKKDSEERQIFSVQLQEKKAQELEKEPTLEDYENVPVSEFGMAMLRGMGWKPEKGIGKNERIIEPSFPVLRAKGLGLGADRKVESPALGEDGEELILKRGSFVQIVSGSKKNMYGQVQSFDEDAGRVIIKAALGGTNLSVNEAMVKIVAKEEYKKSSRVLNLSKYEEYKRKENDNHREYNSSKKIKVDSPEANGNLIQELAMYQ